MSSSLVDLVRDIAERRIRVIDLTQTLTPDFPTVVLPPQFGQCSPFRLEEISRYDERGTNWYWNNFSCGEHTGTHFDAPIHWVSGKDLPNNSVDTIEPMNFFAAACVIDCSREAAANEDFLLTVARIEQWEAEHGRIPPRSWVLLRTDWSKHRRGAAYANRRDDGAHTPGPAPEAVRFLLEERDVHGFGVETINTDAGQARTFTPPSPVHLYMHGKGRYGLQCLCNLDRLPPTGAVIVAAPLKITNGSGSPLRVLALLPA
ncbi:MAG TPA: cyclase family protein [Xanthobacteraceae bacterium]|jgi:kynurenine formamidase